MGDLRPAIAPVLSAFGVAATVLRPTDDAPIETTVVWLLEATMDMPGGGFSRREPLRVLAVPLSDVPELPRGSKISAPIVTGDRVRGWVVDVVDRVEWDHTRAVLVPDPDWDCEG